jgi:hypothetical protein
MSRAFPGINFKRINFKFLNKFPVLPDFVGPMCGIRSTYLLTVFIMKSTYCEYILEKMLSTSEVGPILSLIAPSPLTLESGEIKQKQKQSTIKLNKQSINLS